MAFLLYLKALLDIFKMNKLTEHLFATKRLINEELDEAKEDRRSQVVQCLLKNPGATTVDLGRAVWGRDIAALGRESTQVITTVRTISGALKANAIGRDTRRKPYKYYAISESGKLIGAPEELGGSPVKTKTAKAAKSLGKRFNGSEIENRIKALASKGYSIKNIRSEANGNWYYKIQDPINYNNDIGIGIGYAASDRQTNSPNTDYFYYNSHGKDDNNIGNTWNHSNSSSAGPSGWYTFDQAYIEGVLGRLETKKPELAPTVVDQKKTKVAKASPDQYINIINQEWSSRGTWEGGPKWFDLETGDRGPRTDHGGGDDGDDWMDDEQIRSYREPYVKKWMPILKTFQDRLKTKGIAIKNLNVDYGEKGHISLHIEI